MPLSPVFRGKGFANTGPSIGTLGTVTGATSPLVLTTVTSSVAVGDDIYVVVSWLAPAGTDTVAVTDSAGNTYVRDVLRIHTTTFAAIAILRTRCTAALAIGATITATITSTGSPNSIGMAAMRDNRNAEHPGQIELENTANNQQTTSTTINVNISPAYDRVFAVMGAVVKAATGLTGTISGIFTEHADFTTNAGQAMQVNYLTSYATILGSINATETFSGTPTSSVAVMAMYRMTRRPSGLWAPQTAVQKAATW